MEKFALNVLDYAVQHGASYADVRAVQRRTEELSVKNSQPDRLATTEDAGFGVRVLADGAWGFAASAGFDAESAGATVERALESAQASARIQSDPFMFPARAEEVDVYVTPIEQDPFTLAQETRLALLLDCCEAMQKRSAVHTARASMRLLREHKWFVSSEGSRLEQSFVETGGGVKATAVSGDGLTQQRSFANHAQAGYEFIAELNLLAQAERCADEAEALLTAPVCPTGLRTVILGSQLLAHQIHESCGQAAELDRVLSIKAPFAETSFLTIDELGMLQYGSPVVNIVADATLPRGLGTFGWDDEGSPAERFPIVDRGRFVTYLTSRESAWWLAHNYRHTTPIPPLPFSNGAMRAEGWRQPPLIRVTNLSLEPGSWALGDLVSDTDHGLLLDTPKRWSFDTKHSSFRFDTEVAYEIKNGKLGHLLRDAGYSDTTPRLWNSCDAVCNANHWQLWGMPNYAKGKPKQIVRVAHGAAPARFRGVQVHGNG